jgi:hypothetical protein
MSESFPSKEGESHDANEGGDERGSSIKSENLHEEQPILQDEKPAPKQFKTETVRYAFEYWQKLPKYVKQELWKDQDVSINPIIEIHWLIKQWRQDVIQNIPTQKIFYNFAKDFESFRIEKKPLDEGDDKDANIEAPPRKNLKIQIEAENLKGFVKKLFEENEGLKKNDGTANIAAKIGDLTEPPPVTEGVGFAGDTGAVALADAASSQVPVSNVVDITKANFRDARPVGDTGTVALPTSTQVPVSNDVDITKANFPNARPVGDTRTVALPSCSSL